MAAEGVTVSCDVRWCTGVLLDLASDSCIKVKVVTVSLVDRSPGDVRGRISLSGHRHFFNKTPGNHQGVGI